MAGLFAAVLIALGAVGGAQPEVTVIDGARYVCEDGVCRPLEETEAVPAVAETKDAAAPRLAQGILSEKEMIAFIRGEEPTPLLAYSFLLLPFIVLLGGLALNLTPCVLPMIPVTLIIIGRSARRGAAYGAGIALAYGALGLAAAFGGMAFGEIQASPWFNGFVALVFIVLGLSLSGAFAIDLSRYRPKAALALPFVMGMLGAVLAGACVAPILISVLLLTADLFARGHTLALALPFVLGLGMALPWPFAGAGLKVLPKPGAWMKWVNRGFAVFVFAFAAWYGVLCWKGFAGHPEGARGTVEGDALEATPATFTRVFEMLEPTQPVFVDCWASWCKNCSAMDRVLRQPEVQRALKGCKVIRLQAENMQELRKIRGFEAVKGLPAFLIFEGGRSKGGHEKVHFQSNTPLSAEPKI